MGIGVIFPSDPVVDVCPLSVTPVTFDADADAEEKVVRGAVPVMVDPWLLVEAAVLLALVTSVEAPETVVEVESGKPPPTKVVF